MRLLLVLSVASIATGCMRYRQITTDSQGATYVVAQKGLFGLTGKPTLLVCKAGYDEVGCTALAEGRDVLVPLDTATADPFGLGDLGDLWGGDYDGEPVECPRRAETGDTLPNGARVTLLGIHSDDAYAGSEWDGQQVSGVVDGDLHSNDGCWYGGGFIADSGDDFYFYKAAFRLDDGSTAVVEAGASCPEGASTTDRFGDAAKVAIVGLHPDDAYHDSTWLDLLPIEGRVDGDLHNNGGCWFGGGFIGSDGESYYFYKAAVEPR